MRLVLIIFLLPICLFANLSVQERYSNLVAANEHAEWKQLIIESEAILKDYAESPFAQEALFYLAVGSFKEGGYEWANHYFSEYLKQQATAKHFEEAIEYKFEIAQKFKEGTKKHILGTKLLPKWMPAKSDALTIYDEVITALPHHDLAAKALYSKAQLLTEDEDFRASIETYQTLIRRFPKNSLAADSYIGICQVYLAQSKAEYPDPDFLDLSEINLRKFRTNFPREERVSVAEGIFAQMQERYAQDLFETGRFFERTQKYSAALIYYTKILTSFPNTRTVTQSKQRLEIVKAKLAKQKK